MGKKKKGCGAQKTAAKTEKKLAQKMKKQLELTGEDDIAAIVAQIEKEEQEKLKVVEKVISTPPTRRAYFSLVAHPEKDELILFGGEFHNGKETEVYNDLFVYKISKDEWRIIKSPGGPNPRSGHQCVAVPACKGQMWLFGGEYTTKSESQFYHYKDLWCLTLQSYQWEKINSPGGPSSRSGHRMVHMKKQLFVFGGYHDNLIEYKYFNDIYMFSLEDRIWTKLEPVGIGPCPRSACQFCPTPDGTFLVWGGYSKLKLKKEVEKGQVHNDMFLLTPPKADGGAGKFKWSAVRSKGCKPAALSGVSVAFDGLRAYTFGGAQDTDSEEDLTTQFFNQLHSLNLSTHVWSQVTLSGKKSSKTKKRRKEKGGDDEESDGAESEPEEEVVTERVIYDGAFVTRIGGPSASSEQPTFKEAPMTPCNPHPRICAGAVIKSSKLFIYGGVFEKADVVCTLSDMHVLDLQKCDEWKELISCDLESQEWFKSDESSSGEEEEGEDEDSEDTSDED